MLIDTHCHLTNEKYSKTEKQLVEEALDVDVVRLINIGTSIDDNLQVIAITESFANVYCALAIYPHENTDVPTDKLIEDLEKQLQLSPKIVALGECGIDISDWPGGRSIAEQIKLFEKQIQLALKLKLPLIIHNRDGDKAVLELLKEYVPQGLTGVVHCFSSPLETAWQLLDLGFYLSFSGMITYKPREDLREIAKMMPNDKILVETDAPYLAPQKFRGQVNEPKYVVEVAKQLADIKNLPFDKICQFSYSNTCQLFNLPPV